MAILLKYSLLDALSVFGVFLVLKRAKFPDFGLIGSFMLGAYATAAISKNVGLIIIAPLIAPILGSLLALVTVSLHYRMNINPLISGISSLFFSYTVCLLILNPSTWGDQNESVLYLNNLLGILALATTLALLVVIFICLNRTYFGLKLTAVALTENTSPFLIPNENRYYMFWIIAGNAIVAFSGSIQVYFQRQVEISIATGWFERIIIAMVIGLALFDLAEYAWSRRRKTNYVVNGRIKTLRDAEYAIPIVGAFFYNIVHTLADVYFPEAETLRGLIALGVIFLLLLIRRYNIGRLSTIRFSGF